MNNPLGLKKTGIYIPTGVERGVKRAGWVEGGGGVQGLKLIMFEGAQVEKGWWWWVGGVDAWPT